MSTIGDKAALKPLVRPANTAGAGTVNSASERRVLEEHAELEDSAFAQQQFDSFQLAHGERDAMRARALAFALRADSSFAERPGSGDGKTPGKTPKRG